MYWYYHYLWYRSLSFFRVLPTRLFNKYYILWELNNEPAVVCVGQQNEKQKFNMHFLYVLIAPCRNNYISRFELWYRSLSIEISTVEADSRWHEWRLARRSRGQDTMQGAASPLTRRGLDLFPYTRPGIYHCVWGLNVVPNPRATPTRNEDSKFWTSLEFHRFGNTTRRREARGDPVGSLRREKSAVWRGESWKWFYCAQRFYRDNNNGKNWWNIYKYTSWNESPDESRNLYKLYARTVETTRSGERNIPKCQRIDFNARYKVHVDRDVRAALIHRVGAISKSN